MPPASQASWLCLPLLAAAALLAGCDALEAFPRDPEGTLERVRGGTLRAGILHAPPWVEALDEPRGPEAEIVRTLARELDAEVRWVRGAPDQLLLLLEEHQLDLVAGGFEERSPALAKVGKTRPWSRTAWWLAGQGDARNLANEEVTVRHGRAAALVREAGGTPVHGEETAPLRAVPVPVPPRPADALRRLGETPQVLALPPGENAWLVAVDRTIHRLRRDAGGEPDAGR